MVAVRGRIDGWWNEFDPEVIQREISRVLVLNLSVESSGAHVTPTRFLS